MRRHAPDFSWNGKSLVEPEIASDTCSSTFGTTSKTAFLADGGMGSVSGWQVGKNSGSFPTTATVEFTDNGLYPRIPNLLEPANPLNNALGIGHLIFLNADDDSDTTTKSLVPVADTSTTVNGVPDYDVSAYDGNGRPLPAGSNTDPGVTLYDRTLNLGTLQGGREIIFYLVVFYSSQSQAPCLGRIGGVCKLWLNSPINVWFSRVDLNMDENLSTTSPAATTDIGCGYPSTLQRRRRHVHRLAGPGHVDPAGRSGRRVQPGDAARGGDRPAFRHQPDAARGGRRTQHGSVPLDPRLRGPERRW